MSAPPTSLPYEIRELMTVTVVEWEQSLGTDGYGQSTYASPVQIDAWVESGYAGGLAAYRAALSGNATVSTEEPDLDLYFDGDDANVRAFGMDDRFTPGGVGDTVKLKPRKIATLYGPPFDNTYPWTILVTL